MDTVARFGGDEFVVVLGELDTDKTSSVAQVGIVAEKIRAILAKPYALKLLHEDGTETAIEYQCTSSIGVIIFINHECRPADLLGRADRAMYQAKESGRNQVRFFNM
jgi:diguanylate cyclase (GGDEF)-like protein